MQVVQAALYADIQLKKQLEPECQPSLGSASVPCNSVHFIGQHVSLFAQKHPLAQR